jgi:glycosyltransferase involved in cell wall biosynthesis
MTNSPLVSVVMSVFVEPEKWLRNAIDSILTQTYSNLEFLIINDNYERMLNKRVLDEYAHTDKRIRIITNQSNQGLTKSLNKGISIAQGKYIARMDADDFSLPNRIERQVAFLELNSEVIVCGTNIAYFGMEERNSPRWIKSTNNDIKDYLFTGNCFAHPTVMMRRQILDDHNIIYDESYLQAQDYDMWVKLMNHGEFQNLPEILVEYRVSPSQVSTKNSTAQNDYSFTIRKKLIESYIQNLSKPFSYNYSLNIGLDDFTTIYEIEKLTRLRLKHIGNAHDHFTAIYNSLVYHINVMSISILLFLLVSRIVFRKSFDFGGFMRKIRRSILHI